MADAELTSGHIFDIQGFSVHDGPGCRTLIFLKGCSLSCKWCSNPEGITPTPEPLYRASKCTFDGLCIGACRYTAISHGAHTGMAPLVIDRKKCAQCTTYDCAEACCSGALSIGGYEISVTDLLQRITRDRPYWGEGGGITLTGGEPFMQPRFAQEILKRSYEAYIHTAVETCGNVPWENMQPSLPWIDWIFFDIKHMNDHTHREATGNGNRMILGNAERLAREFKGKIVFRTPLIAGFNDSDAHLREIAGFMRKNGQDTINLLPLHHMGREKYNLTGRSCFATAFSTGYPSSDDHLRALFEAFDVHCYIGSDTPF